MPDAKLNINSTITAALPQENAIHVKQRQSSVVWPGTDSMVQLSASILQNYKNLKKNVESEQMITRRMESS